MSPVGSLRTGAASNRIQAAADRRPELDNVQRHDSRPARRDRISARIEEAGNCPTQAETARNPFRHAVPKCARCRRGVGTPRASKKPAFGKAGREHRRADVVSTLDRPAKRGEAYLRPGRRSTPKVRPTSLGVRSPRERLSRPSIGTIRLWHQKQGRLRLVDALPPAAPR
jgi:hypothetical protein